MAMYITCEVGIFEANIYAFNVAFFYQCVLVFNISKKIIFDRRWFD